VLFDADVLTAFTQTLAWCVIFFFASAGASAAYLTVSEIFPMETRAMAISFFYAVGAAIGGITGPLLFGRLIETGGETNVMCGYLLGAALMAAAGVVEIFFGVEAAQKRSRTSPSRSPPRTPRRRRTTAASWTCPRSRASPARRSSRPGAVMSGWSPFQTSSSRDVEQEDRYLAREVDALERAPRERGELTRRELGVAVDCRLWGPGRFGRALRVALRDGGIRRLRRGVYGPADS
jgi:hypothetical protein